MAVYSLTGGGVAFQSIDPGVPDVDEIQRLRAQGYTVKMIKDNLRREGFEEREIQRVLAQTTSTPYNQEPRFFNPMAPKDFGGGPAPADPFGALSEGGRAATPGHSDQVLAERNAMRELQGGAGPTATAADWDAYMQRVTQGQAPPEFQEGFLGGFPTDFVYRTQTEAPNPMALLGSRYSAEALAPRFSRPTYREGGAYSYMSRIGEAKIREWQSFFAGLGFKTGPAGILNSNDIGNMQAFMGMANGIPGGMTVDILRTQVMDQVRQGVYFFRGVNEQGDLLPLLLDAEAAGDLTAAGGGAPGSQGTQPITQTMTRTINQEISPDQGLLALRRVFSAQTGRAPNDEEIGELVRSVNAAFRADPTVITETTTFDPVTQEQTSTTVEDESDVSVEGAAQRLAIEASPEERQEYLTGRYLDQISSMLGM